MPWRNGHQKWVLSLRKWCGVHSTGQCLHGRSLGGPGGAFHGYSPKISKVTGGSCWVCQGRGFLDSARARNPHSGCAWRLASGPLKLWRSVVAAKAARGRTGLEKGRPEDSLARCLCSGTGILETRKLVCLRNTCVIFLPGMWFTRHFPLAESAEYASKQSKRPGTKLRALSVVVESISGA